MCDNVLHLLDLDVVLEVTPPNLTACEGIASGVVLGVNQGLSLEGERQLDGVEVALLLLVLFILVEEVARRIILRCCCFSQRRPAAPPPSAELDETDLFDDDDDDLSEYTDPRIANDKETGCRV